jgi:Bacteriocin-protection, YdeI or OmpD-Associated/Domain of unknown function (DUF1905)
MVTFSGTLETSGGNATGIAVPEDVWHTLTPAKRAAVVVTLGGHSYPSTIGWYRGAFMLPVSAENRAAAGVSAGDTLEVTLELDAAPRVIEAPADLAAALETDVAAKAAWETLAPSHKKAHVTAIEGAKTAETRQRRVAAAVDKLAGR